MPTFTAEELTEFAGRLLAAGGLGAEEAAMVAESLVGANLRGYDSHGVMRLPFYLGRLDSGEVTPAADFEVLRETASLLSVDAHWGFGQTQARRLTERLIEKAKTSGVGVGTMKC
ncbi:Ldh family oxidoreductase, partial [PVC group bacterium]|nr:Ldh family oxidoreductase [PVC group bacterium]